MMGVVAAVVVAHVSSELFVCYVWFCPPGGETMRDKSHTHTQSSADLPCIHSPSGSAGSGPSSGCCSRCPRAWCNHTGSHACARRPRPCLQENGTEIKASQWRTGGGQLRHNKIIHAGKHPALDASVWMRQIAGSQVNLIKICYFSDRKCSQASLQTTRPRERRQLFDAWAAPVKTWRYFCCVRVLFASLLSVCGATLNKSSQRVLADGTDSRFTVTLNP